MKLNALVIEDCEIMRKMLMQMLPLTGLAEFKFTEAENGVDALARFSPDKTDIVFVDWNMPKLSGIDVVRKIRALEKTAHIPIVMVTGLGRVGNVEEALDSAGASVYITKPYTIDDLRRKLAKVIEGIDAARSQGRGPKQSGILGKLIGGAS